MNSLKKFEVEVTTTNKYIIEFDEKHINSDWMESYKENFYNYDSLEKHAEHLAETRATLHNKSESFYEGYGNIRIIRGGFDSKEWEKVTDGITLKVVSEGEEAETVAREIVRL